MNALDLYVDTITRSDGVIRRALEDLSVEELRAQPSGSGSNPIGWLVWHLTRVRDSIISSIADQPTIWESQAYNSQFELEGEVPRFTPENVHDFDPKAADVLVGYFNAVAGRTIEVVAAFSPDDLERLIPSGQPDRPPQSVGSRLAVILNDNIQHVGQVAYLRGVIRGQGWF